MSGRKWMRLFLSLTLLLLPLLSFPTVASGQQPVVYVIPLEGTVDASLLRYLQRSFAVAEASKAEAIILEINTPGGLLSASFEISDLIWASPLPVYSYVRFNALSAGAFLALSSRALYMAPGSAIGAAEPRTMDGQTADEKVLSAWEARMRAVAERQGKDPEVAAAMVRMEGAIPDVDEVDTLLTLTYREAKDIEFADGIFDSIPELLAELDLADAVVRTVPLAPAEALARLLTNPVVATIFVAVGIAALSIAVMTGDFLLPGGIGILAFALFFGGHIFAGLAGREVIFLFAAGLFLLIIEAFIPSFGVVGVAGLSAVSLSVAWAAAATGQGWRLLLIAVLAALVLVILVLRLLKRSPAWSHIVLKYSESKALGYVGPKDSSSLVGATGTTITPLRPAGLAEINGTRLDVVSDGSFIPSATQVVVVKTEGTRIVVRPR